MRRLAIPLLTAAIAVGACGPDEPEMSFEPGEPFPDVALTAAVAAGPDGDVFVADWDAAANVRRFSDDGRPRDEWDTRASQLDLRCPFAAASSGTGHVYVLSRSTLEGPDARRADTIDVVAPDGAPAGSIDDLAEGGLDLAADASDRLYVALAEQHGVRVFGADGERIGDWSAEEMPFTRPVSVAVDGRGRLVVADISLTDDEASQIVVLSADGDLLDGWDVDLPRSESLRDVTVDDSGRVYAITNHGLIRAFTESGEPLGEVEPARIDGEPTTADPDCPPVVLPPRIQAGTADRLYWTPPWDPFAHPPAGLHVMHVGPAGTS